MYASATKKPAEPDAHRLALPGCNLETPRKAIPEPYDNFSPSGLYPNNTPRGSALARTYLPYGQESTPYIFILRVQDHAARIHKGWRIFYPIFGCIFLPLLILFAGFNQRRIFIRQTIEGKNFIQISIHFLYRW